ncbi:MAG: peptidoglycan DD-metalloendopeptidase family protein [Ruminococcus sp.]|nr:peptidoglycan DD-metalloendopeptidase family protein [Ruminococcus sp.]
MIKKIFSFLMCSALSAILIVNFPYSEKNNSHSAKTIPEIQEERKANEEKISQYEKQMAELGENMTSEQAFQDALGEQIYLIQDNISLLNQELDRLGSDIKRADENISYLDFSIVQRQKQLDESIELFKKRLCAMYMSGNNDSMISMLVGSTSFYDMMTRIKVVNNMAEYDQQLINTILSDIESLEKDRRDLETEKQNLKTKLSEQETKKSEKTAEIQSLNDKMSQSVAMAEQLKAQQEKIKRSKDEAQALIGELDRQEIEIQEEIRRKAEEAQRRYEEEERKKQEELLRQQAEQKRLEEQQRLEAENNRNQQQQQQIYDEWLEQRVPQTDSIPPPSEQSYVWPTPDYYYITSPYGERDGAEHRGIDIGDADIHGGNVVAVRSGIVIAVNNSCDHDYGKDGSCGCGGDFGNYVIISHDGTYSSLYAHMSTATVSVGDYVQQGQVVGKVGSTGWSTGPHLHFEIRVDGYADDPMNYVSP